MGEALSEEHHLLEHTVFLETDRISTCMGSVLTYHIVLTSAHCLVDAERVYIYPNVHNSSSEALLGRKAFMAEKSAFNIHPQCRNSEKCTKDNLRKSKMTENFLRIVKVNFR